MKQKKFLLELQELAKGIRVKLAQDILTENAILKGVKDKSNLLDLPEENLAGSQRTESEVTKTTKEIHFARKIELSTSVAGFRLFRVNPVNPSLQSATDISTSKLIEFNTDNINPLHSRSEIFIIQNNTQYIPRVPQTSIKSTVLPVRFIQNTKS